MDTEGRILVVDDGSDERDDLRWAAEPDVNTVVTADSAARAIALLNAEQFDVIVTDLEMEQKQSGLVVLKHAQAVDRDLPVILVTAYGSKEVSIDTMESGAFDYIERNSKATDTLEMLRAKISLALRFRRLSKEGTQRRISSSSTSVGVPGVHESTYLNVWFADYPGENISLPVGTPASLIVNIDPKLVQASRGTALEGAQDGHLFDELASLDVVLLCGAAEARPVRASIALPPGPDARVTFMLTPQKAGVISITVLLLTANQELYRSVFVFAAHDGGVTKERG